MTDSYPGVSTPETEWSTPTWNSAADDPAAPATSATSTGDSWVSDTAYGATAGGQSSGELGSGDQGSGGQSSRGQGSGDQGTADVAKEQAADLKQGAVEAGQNVAAVAKEQASTVTAEAGAHAKDLLHQARGEVTDQAGQQQQRLASGLRALAEELGSMANHSEQKGVASDLAQQASAKSHEIASWFDEREPGKIVEELRSFARQRPGAFLALAAGAGLVAGRLTRGLKAASDDTDPSATSTGPRGLSATPAPAALSATGTDGLPAAYPVEDSGYAIDRPFASSQDVQGQVSGLAPSGPLSAEGDFPVPSRPDAAAWRDESTL